MGAPSGYLNRVVAALLTAVLLFGAAAQAMAQPAPAQEAQELEALKSPDGPTWRKAESNLLRQWSLSGSPAMDLLMERAQAALKAGDPNAAVGHLTAVIDHAPTFEDAYNLRAAAYVQLGLFGPAVADIGKALTLNPHDFRALSGLGMIFEGMNRPKDALAAYQMALAIHPHLARVLRAVKRLQAQAAGQEL